MELKSVYLTKGGGITSTSANHLANLAKEKVEGNKLILKDMLFYDTSVTLDGTSVITSNGMSEEEFHTIPQLIQEIQEAHGFIAWVREAIKAKETLHKKVGDIVFDDYLSIEGISLPAASKCSNVTSNDYFENITSEQLASYLMLEAKCSVIGDIIHKGNCLSEARKGLIKVKKKPAIVKTTNDKSFIEQYTPTISETVVETLFFDLQKKHREAQAKLNGKKKTCNDWVYEKNQANNTRKADELDAYNNERKRLLVLFNEWKNSKLKEVEELKIVVPSIFNDFINKIQS